MKEDGDTMYEDEFSARLARLRAKKAFPPGI